jgi:hypothetical protein
MNNSKYIKQSLALMGMAMLMLTCITSCSKQTEELTSIDYDRFFSVQNIKIARTEETLVELAWDKPKHANGDVNYVVELAEDQGFAGETLYTFESETNSLTLTDADIAVRKIFYARIKTSGDSGLKESKWSYSSSFRIVGLQLLRIAKYEDITSTSITLRWIMSDEVTPKK